MKWHPAQYEQSVVEQLLSSQFHTFVNKVKTTDCQAELRRLLAAGPPIYISDKHAMPLPEVSTTNVETETTTSGTDETTATEPTGDTHIIKLWYASDGEERSAKLDGAVEGEERQKLWDELKKFIIVEGKEEGDDDDGEGQQ